MDTPTTIRRDFLKPTVDGSSPPGFILLPFVAADGQKTENADQGDAVELMLLAVLQDMQ